MPTVTRELVDGPSREELFDALRLHSEGRIVTFGVALPSPQSTLPVDCGPEKTEEELLELVLGAMPYYPMRVDSIAAVGITGELWRVRGVLEESPYTGKRPITLEAYFNTKRRRESGSIVASWEPKQD